jgi:hypothetical protein
MERLDMINSVGLNTNYNLLSNNIGVGNSLTNSVTTTDNNSIFNTLNSTANTDYYNNDMFMSGINFSELAQNTLGGTQNDNNQTQNVQSDSKNLTPEVKNLNNQQNFTGNNIQQNEDNEINPQELENYLTNRDNNEEGIISKNNTKKSNKFKYLGALCGFLAPIITAGIEGIKKGNLKNVFKLKQLAVTCPIIGVTGFAAGLLLDGLVNSSKAKNAQTKTLENQQAA